MADLLKISGKRVALPDPAAGWKLESRPGGWIVATAPDGSRRRIALTEARGRISFSAGGKLWSGEVSAGASRQRATTTSGGGDADLVSQFPGKVRKLLVQAGHPVDEGTPLVLIEAMKMEFSIKAPFKGKVSRVHVREGQQISPGDRFVDLEPEDGEGGAHGG